jgi:potassium efflux system protein
VLFTIDLFRNICREGGLGDAHFGWDAQRVKSIRRGLHWLVFILAPLTYIISALEAQSLDARRDSLGRFAMIAAMAALAVFCWQALRPQPREDESETAPGPAPWSYRLRWITCCLTVATPLFLAGIAAWGYYYTAVQLSSRLIQSVWFLQSLSVANAILLRWLLMARRRMALDHARKRRTAQAAAPAGAPAVTPEMEMSLATVGDQAKRMLGIVVTLTAIIGLFVVWVDVLPALAVFQRVVLWTDGDNIVTLADLGLGLCILLLTFAASSNGPGLLEILLFNRLPLDPGARYAATAVARYLITAAGIIGGASVIGFRWSQVQWLVAAVTVGLGFGLQEIFANFVSGLIILFERPIRVGDVVTVGNVSGRVARIRIRATTIVDWDRKELIVPNKEFVTGQVLNWTLTDSIVRIVLKVGTAYDSNPQQVVELLLNVARDLPKVLRDPAPQAVCLGFGDSALMFELRVFVPNLDVFGEVQHALHVETLKALTDAGVEIPFPQRDLRIRTAAPWDGAAQDERRTEPKREAPENGAPKPSLPKTSEPS